MIIKDLRHPKTAKFVDLSCGDVFTCIDSESIYMKVSMQVITEPDKHNAYNFSKDRLCTIAPATEVEVLQCELVVHPHGNILL